MSRTAPFLTFRRGGLAIVVAIGLAAEASCGDAPEGPPPKGPYFALSPLSASLLVGESLTFTVTGRGSGRYRWTSSDPAIAVVSGAGVVRAIAPGRSSITIHETTGLSAGSTASVEVTAP